MDLSLIIPVFNNETSLEKLVLEVITSTSGWTNQIEIIFINDASTDNSLDILRQLVKKYNQVFLIENESNIGQQRSLYKGLQVATGLNIAMMDADLQDSPLHLKKMYENTSSNSSCFIKRKGQYQSKGKMITSFILKYIISLITGLNTKAGSYLMMGKNVRTRVLEKKVNFTYLTVLTACFSDQITYIEATRSKRYSGKSAYSFSKRIQAGVKAIFCAIQCRFF